MNWTLLSVIVDIALGGMAYNLAWKLSKVQEKQTLILDNLMGRVMKLETNGVRSRHTGFIPIPAEDSK